MQPIPFVKMDGLGNDFVVVDGQHTQATPDLETIRALANRHSGIGCDQVLWLTPPKQPTAPFLYRIFNADGAEVGQCGNGARCVGYYVQLFYPEVSFPITLQTISGRLLTVDKMANPSHFSATMGLPKAVSTAQSIAEVRTIKLGQHTFSFYALDFGNPHMVVLFDAPWSDLDLQGWGQALQTHALFPEGVNVEFIRCLSATQLEMRVYERGVGETQACASGACAAAVAGCLAGRVGRDVAVQMPGGTLQVTWPTASSEVTQAGAVALVFMGQWGFEVADAQNPHVFRVAHAWGERG